jgi:hypothetical protein
MRLRIEERESHEALTVGLVSTDGKVDWEAGRDSGIARVDGEEEGREMETSRGMSAVGKSCRDERVTGRWG